MIVLKAKNLCYLNYDTNQFTLFPIDFINTVPKILLIESKAPA